MKSIMIAALLLAALLLVFPAPANANDATDLLTAKVELATARLSYGETHPSLVELKNRVAALESAGVEIDLAEANVQFKELVREREQLLSGLGLRHPRVIATTRKIVVLASVLADLR